MIFSMEKDAIDLLKQDHRVVESLFSKLESTESSSEKVALAQQICTELSIHAKVEETVFYPAARKAFNAEQNDMIDEADVEHTSLKRLIADIDGHSPSDDLFDANLKVLKEYVQHHVKEEENELMPAVRKTDIDLKALAKRIQDAKETLKRQAGVGAKPTKTSKSSRVQLPSVLTPPSNPVREKKSSTEKSPRKAAGARQRSATSAATKKATGAARKASGSRARRATAKKATAKKSTARKSR